MRMKPNYKKENEILQRFIDIMCDEIEWDFEVPIGEEKDFYKMSKEERVKLVKRKRIDAVGRDGRIVYIVEVKKRLKPEVLGQLKTYEYLWKKKHKDDYIMLIAVAGEDDEVTHKILDEHKIRVYIV